MTPFVILCERVSDESGVGVSKGRIFYEVLGDYPAPSFFNVDNTTGEVRVVQDLRTDNLRLGSYTVSVIIMSASSSCLSPCPSCQYPPLVCRVFFHQNSPDVQRSVYTARHSPAAGSIKSV